MRYAIPILLALTLPASAQCAGPLTFCMAAYYHVHRCPVGYHRIEGRCKMILPRRNHG